MEELTSLRHALEQSPNNISLWLLYGQSCVSSHRWIEARSAFDRALVLDPNEPEALLGIAQVLYREGKLSESAVRVQSLLSERKDFAPAHMLMCRIYLAEDNAQLAAEHYHSARCLSKSVADRDIEHRLGKHWPLLENESEHEPAKLMASAEFEEDSETDYDFFGPSDDDFQNYDDGSYDDGFDVEDEEEEEYFDFEEFERPNSSFSDVAGLEDVKEELLMKLVYPYHYQDLFRSYGKKAGGGILLYGPPGCGKSLVCRALAGETEAAFYNVKLHQILEMYVGSSEKNLHEVFQVARENAPAVLFFDELDALGADRTELKNRAARSLVNQFLVELDGHDGCNEGLLVIAATSAPWNVDPAFQRPGRFDRRIEVPPPDFCARQKILKLQSRNRPVDVIDFEHLAGQTEGFSGADLVQIFELATEDALRIAMRNGEVEPITMSMLQSAIARIEPSTALWREQQDRRQSNNRPF